MTFALLASLVVALTVVPVLAYFLVDRVKMDVDEDGEPRKSLWIRAYTPTITFALRSRRTKFGVLGAATALFFATLALVPSLPTQFINAGSEKVLLVSLAPPPGTGSSAVLERAIKAEGIIKADPKVTTIQTTVPCEGGTGFQTLTAAFTGRASNSANITVRLASDANLSQHDAEAARGPRPREGRRLGRHRRRADRVQLQRAERHRQRPRHDDRRGRHHAGPRRDQGPARHRQPQERPREGHPAVEVLVDPNKAIAAGLTTAQVAGEVRGVLTGTQVGHVQGADGPDLDLYMAIDPTALASVDALKALPVGTATKVPLAAIADVNEVEAQGSITRIDGAPASSITAEITSKDQGGVSRSVQQKIDDLKAAGTLPAGVDVRLAGVTQQQNTAFGGLFASMAVAILLVYLALVLTFNSLITPFIILFSLPLATIGAFIALYITGRPIGISALIGFLMLIGIVVTNAIVLLDLVEKLRARGEPTHEALVEGGRTRVRPILMTALATILALMPLGLGLNEGSIIASELATVVIGGLFSSTFLTLIVIPVLYSLVDGGKSGLSQRFRRQPAPEAAAPEPAAAPPAPRAPDPDLGRLSPAATPRHRRRGPGPRSGASPHPAGDAVAGVRASCRPCAILPVGRRPSSCAARRGARPARGRPSAGAHRAARLPPWPTPNRTKDSLADRMVVGSRYLTILAVIGSFLASITVQVYGLIRAVVNTWDAFITRDFSDAAAKAVLVDAVSTIDLFLLGTILFVFSIGFYQLFIEEVPPSRAR